MLKADGDKVRVQAVLTKEIYDRLRKEADRKGLSVSAYLRMILIERFENSKEA